MGKTICGKSRVLLGFIAAIGIIGAIVACGGEPAAEPDTAANRTKVRAYRSSSTRPPPCRNQRLR